MLEEDATVVVLVGNMKYAKIKVRNLTAELRAGCNAVSPSTGLFVLSSPSEGFTALNSSATFAFKKELWQKKILA